MSESPRVLIVAPNASARFGGEAVLPLHYFRFLRERGVCTRLLVHARTRAELKELFPEDQDRIAYVEDARLHRALWAVQRRMHERVGEVTAGNLIAVLTEIEQVRRARQLIVRHHIDVVHQPIPVSPKGPSLLRNLGVPVVLGPLNGGMDYPPAFAHFEGYASTHTVRALRRLSSVVHRVARGKLDATTILVANERTRRALPAGLQGRIIELVENGVDLTRFEASPRSAPAPTGPGLRAAFVGRLIELKAVDVAIDALARAREVADVRLEVLGDGPMRQRWESFARERGLDHVVHFRGFVPQRELPALLRGCDVLLLPSLRECGGAVVLEAMALGLPVVATAWGGPLDYIDPATGFLIEPTSREALVAGFAQALVTLARNPELAASIGARARQRVLEEFDWRKKVDHILHVYAEAIERFRSNPGADLRSSNGSRHAPPLLARDHRSPARQAEPSRGPTSSG